jgi:hypothetical protein
MGHPDGDDAVRPAVEHRRTLEPEGRRAIGPGCLEMLIHAREAIASGVRVEARLAVGHVESLSGPALDLPAMSGAADDLLHLAISSPPCEGAHSVREGARERRYGRDEAERHGAERAADHHCEHEPAGPEMIWHDG